MAVEGPYSHVDLGNGFAAPLYLLRYDKNGKPGSPKSEAIARRQIETDAITDVFVFSHGWNNTFDVALDRYTDFIRGFEAQRKQFDVPLPDPYRPVLVGVVWPSTRFVLPWENGPKIAGGATTAVKGLPTAQQMARLLRPRLGADADEFDALVSGERGGADDAERLAELLRERVWEAGTAEDPATAPTVDDLLTAAAYFETGAAGFGQEEPEHVHLGEAGGGAGEPVVAGGVLDAVRGLLRVGTVFEMKNRAGVVGGHGVADLARHVLDKSEARLHLVGHSFGARVVLSALAVGEPARRKAHSVLLLQGALNRWCFAADVVDTHVPGGYRPVLDRVERPVYTTISDQDLALHDAWHLAVKGAELGVPKIAAIGDSRRFGALGGYGPEGLSDAEYVRKAAVRAGTFDAYPVDGVRVVGIDGGLTVDGKPAIGGHGDVSNPVTWWALHRLSGA